MGEKIQRVYYRNIEDTIINGIRYVRRISFKENPQKICVVFMQQPRYTDGQIEETINGICNFFVKKGEFDGLTFVNIKPTCEKRTTKNEIATNIEQIKDVTNQKEVSGICLAYGKYSNKTMKRKIAPILKEFIEKKNNKMYAFAEKKEEQMKLVYPGRNWKNRLDKLWKNVGSLTDWKNLDDEVPEAVE